MKHTNFLAIKNNIVLLFARKLGPEPFFVFLFVYFSHLALFHFD